MATKIVTQEFLKKKFKYLPEIGIFLYRKTYKEAGWIDNTKNLSYRRVQIFGKAYRVHRLIWLYMTGEWPDKIDHQDHNGLNNKWINLRNGNQEMNMRNMSKRKDNKSGITGVYWKERDNLWYAEISIDGISKYIGARKDFFEACCLRKSTENGLGYHINHGSDRCRVTGRLADAEQNGQEKQI